MISRGYPWLQHSLVFFQLQLNELDARHDREEKMRTIRKRIDNLTGSLVHVDRTSAGYRQSLSNTLSRQILLWEIELESGGNVKFSPGGVEMSWYKSCVDLVNSRFSAASVLVREIEYCLLSVIVVLLKSACECEFNSCRTVV